MLTYHISYEKIFSTALYVHGRSGVNASNLESMFCMLSFVSRDSARSSFERVSKHFVIESANAAHHLAAPGGGSTTRLPMTDRKIIQYTISMFINKLL